MSTCVVNINNDPIVPPVGSAIASANSNPGSTIIFSVT